MNPLDLDYLVRRWQRHRHFGLTLTSLAVGLAAAAVVIRFSGLGAAIAGTAAALVWFSRQRKTAPITPATVAAHLDRICPALEESSALWLRDPATLTLVENLQLKRLNAAWTSLPHRPPPGGQPSLHSLRGPSAAATISLLAVVILALIPPSSRHDLSDTAAGPAAIQSPERISLRQASLEIAPPAYLGLSSRRSATLDAEVPEGSDVTWELTFTGPVQEVALTATGRGITPEVENLGAGRFRSRATIVATTLYQLETVSIDGIRTRLPQLYVLKVARDLPPRLTWTTPAETRTTLPPANATRVRVQVDATDDHGVAGVELVATLAKGSGEGVKFRERTLALQRGPVGADGSIPFAAELDLIALGLEAGDELYVHANARDHRQPAANVTRSETRFFLLQGPTATLTDPAVVATGVKRMPQFFRSQRQLIIDTEQLLAERPKLTPERFQQRSDEIGIDQKLLRLRYGQFLGEEFESPTAGAPPEAEAMGFAARLRSGDRNSAQRDAAVARAVEAQHDHPAPVAEERRPATVESMAAPYVHRHDSPEAATIFDPKVKSTLRAVLAEMWTAEGHLRGGRPADALPAEHRALELLKELQQADRVYVARTGFEPAPINLEQRRLRGELDAIPSKVATPAPTGPDDESAALLRTVLARSDAWETLPSEQAKATEEQLTRAAQERPESYVAVLQLWRRRAAGLSAAERQSLHRALLTLLPPAQPRPERGADSDASLTSTYLDQLSGTTEKPIR